MREGAGHVDEVTAPSQVQGPRGEAGGPTPTRECNNPEVEVFCIECGDWNDLDFVLNPGHAKSARHGVHIECRHGHRNSRGTVRDRQGDFIEMFASEIRNMLDRVGGR